MFDTRITELFGIRYPITAGKRVDTFRGIHDRPTALNPDLHCAADAPNNGLAKAVRRDAHGHGRAARALQVGGGEVQRQPQDEAHQGGT